MDSGQNGLGGKHVQVEALSEPFLEIGIGDHLEGRIRQPILRMSPPNISSMHCWAMMLKGMHCPVLRRRPFAVASSLSSRSRTSKPSRVNAAVVIIPAAKKPVGHLFPIHIGHRDFAMVGAKLADFRGDGNSPFVQTEPFEDRLRRMGPSRASPSKRVSAMLLASPKQRPSHQTESGRTFPHPRRGCRRGLHDWREPLSSWRSGCRSGDWLLKRVGWVWWRRYRRSRANRSHGEGS